MVRSRVNNNGIDEQRRRVPRFRIFYCRRRRFFSLQSPKFWIIIEVGYSGIGLRTGEGNRIKKPPCETSENLNTARNEVAMVYQITIFRRDVVA